MTTVIGLTGPAGSGKTTIANYLARTYGARLFAFADPLKRLIALAFPELPRESLYGTQAQKEAPVDALGGLSGRYLMQRIGTNGIRQVFGENFWADFMVDEIEKLDPKLAVVQDVRFHSEADVLLDSPEEVYLWRVAPPWLEITADPTHQSEIEWKTIEVSHVIAPQEKTLEALYAAVDSACALFGITPALHSIEAP